MKNSILKLMFVLVSGLLFSQEYKPLTIKETGKRLLPQFAMAVYTPIMEITLDEIKKQRKEHAEKPWPELTNKDSVEVTQSKICLLYTSPSPRD